MFAEGARITKELIDDVWHNGDEVIVDHVVDIMFAVSGTGLFRTIISYTVL